jgi:hypothetical protein
LSVWFWGFYNCAFGRITFYLTSYEYSGNDLNYYRSIDIVSVLVGIFFNLVVMNIHDKIEALKQRKKRKKMPRKTTDPVLKKFASDSFERLNPEE